MNDFEIFVVAAAIVVGGVAVWREYARRGGVGFYLFGFDPHTRKMKALAEIDECHRKLSAILSQSIFDKDFDERRTFLQKSLDQFYNLLSEAVTFNNWWDLDHYRTKKG